MIEKWLKLALVVLILVWIATIEVVIGFPLLYLTGALVVVLYLERGHLLWIVWCASVVAVVYGMSLTVTLVSLLMGYWALMYGKSVVPQPAVRLFLCAVVLSVLFGWQAGVVSSPGVMAAYVCSASVSLIVLSRVVGWRGETKVRYRPIK